MLTERETQRQLAYSTQNATPKAAPMAIPVQAGVLLAWGFLSDSEVMTIFL